MKRLVAFIIIFALFLAFIIFNLDNKSDVSFGFATFRDTPVFLTAFSSFVLGMLFSLPFTLGKKRQDPPQNRYRSWLEKKRSKKGISGNAGKTGNADAVLTDGIHSESGQDRPDEIKKEKSPYGID